MLQQSSNTRGEALLIVTMLTSYFVKLSKLAACQARGIPEQQAASRIGVSPFFVKEYSAALRQMGRRAVDEAFPALLAADFELKGGADRDERLIVMLLLRKLVPARTVAPVRGAAHAL